jgi:hypothetical protein
VPVGEVPLLMQTTPELLPPLLLLPVAVPLLELPTLPELPLLLPPLEPPLEPETDVEPELATVWLLEPGDEARLLLVEPLPPLELDEGALAPLEPELAAPLELPTEVAVVLDREQARGRATARTRR